MYFNGDVFSKTLDDIKCLPCYTVNAVLNISILILDTLQVVYNFFMCAKMLCMSECAVLKTENVLRL